MRKTLVLLICLNGLWSAVLAQKTDYDQDAQAIKAEVWDTKDTDFDSNQVPDAYKNESAVILAKRFDIDAKVKKHFRLTTAVRNKEILFRYLLRQKVLIQDKSALEDFSEISYNKISKSSFGLFFSRFTDESNTFIGAKVYKKNGTVKEVMLSEAVMTKDEKNRKDEKLAIPDLEVGDILDYYIVTVERKEISNLDPLQFLMTDEYPIVRLSLQGSIDKRYAVEYKSMNGAPDLKIKHDEDGDMVFLVKASHLDKFSVNQWISPMRQVKMVRLRISLCGTGMPCTPGEVTNSLTDDELYKHEKNSIKQYAAGYARGFFGGEQRRYVKENIKALKKRLGNRPPVDSLIATIYNSIRYQIYFAASANQKIYPDKQKNHSSVDNNLFSLFVSLNLKDYDIDNEIIFFSNRYKPRLEEMMSYDRPDFMVHVKGQKEYFLTDQGIFSQFNLVPGYAEGEKGVTLEYDDARALYSDNRRHLDQGNIKIPVSKADDNKYTEQLNLDLALTPSPTVTVDRTETASGLMKENEQENLLLYEDYYADAFRDQGEEKTFITEFAESRKTKSLAEEWQNAFSKARESYKDVFLEDLKNEYHTDPRELISYQINHTGVAWGNSTFSYSSKFVMGDWIKKAGNNYLFEIGKCIGQQSVIKTEYRTRTLDIYQPFARSFEYQVTLPIPAGYTALGLDSLNKNISNDCGHFVSTTAVQANKLVVSIKKEYSHPFEPAANWPKLLAIMDAAADFNNVKLLLKKN